MTWQCLEEPGSAGCIHVIPIRDLLAHSWDNCACLPETEPVKRDDGSYGWLITHEAWDGRK